MGAIEDWAAELLEWELRGRGWDVWDAPVRLEPAFRPVSLIPPPPGIDDGRRPTRLSRLIEWCAGLLAPEREPAPTADRPRPADAQPAGDSSSVPVEWRVALLPTTVVDADVLGRLVGTLGRLRRPLTLELIGCAGEVHVHCACDATDVRAVEPQLRALFPSAVVTRAQPGLRELWGTAAGGCTDVIDFGLGTTFLLPLAEGESRASVLAGVIAALSTAGRDELAVFQVLVDWLEHPWVTEALRFGSLADDAEGTLLARARRKLGRPLSAVVVRIAVRAGTAERTAEIVRAVGGVLASLADPLGNEFIPLANDGYADNVHVADVLDRRTHRSGMLLNAIELQTLLRLPADLALAPALAREPRTTRPVPSLALGHRLVIGENLHAGERREVSLSTEHRLRHTYVIGASGTGKSSLLLNMLVADIEAGEGVGLLDPHGDLADEVLSRIPADRQDEVVVFDPSDETHPVPFNVLTAHSGLERTLLASDLVGIFRRLSTSWGDQMNSVLGNAVLAFLESATGGTLADLRRFLIEADYRKAFLATVRDEEVVYYWQKQYPLLVGRPQGPVLTRLDAFLRPKPLRRVVGAHERSLDVASLMDTGKIFIAKLAHGGIGEENASLLGALLVAKFHQVAMGRQAVQAADRRPFWLYIDEFHHFVTPSVAAILAGARKYKLGLVLAHQDLRQLESRDAEVANAILGNAGSRICFRLGERDAKILAEGFMHFSAGDLQRLGTGEAICRLAGADHDFNMTTRVPGAIDRAAAARVRDSIIQRSRALHGRPLDVPASAAPVAPAPAPTSAPPRDEPAPVVSAPAESLRQRPVMRPEPAPLGRGGTQHKYLQELVKQYAEGLGYRAVVEDLVAGGRGIDVGLHRADRSIACEISVSTDGEHELGNVRKALAGSYTYVLVLSTDAKRVARLQRRIRPEVEALAGGRLRFVTVDECFAFLQNLELERVQQEATVRGYKVKTTVDQGGAAPIDRRDAVTRVVAGALKRLGRG